METITKERKLKIVITLLTITLITCIFLWITSQRNHRIEVDKLKTENARQLAECIFFMMNYSKRKTKMGDTN